MERFMNAGEDEWLYRLQRYIRLVSNGINLLKITEKCCVWYSKYFFSAAKFELFQFPSGKFRLQKLQIEFWAIKHCCWCQDSDKPQRNWQLSVRLKPTAAAECNPGKVTTADKNSTTTGSRDLAKEQERHLRTYEDSEAVWLVIRVQTRSGSRTSKLLFDRVDNKSLTQETKATNRKIKWRHFPIKQ